MEKNNGGLSIKPIFIDECREITSYYTGGNVGTVE